MSHERRVFVDIALLPNRDLLTQVQLHPVPLSPSDSHHLRDVLRLGKGASLVVVDRDTGGQFHATITTVGDPILVTVGSPLPRAPRGVIYPSVMLFALCKGKKNEFVVEKCTELGLETIILWQAERSIVRLDSEADRIKRQDKFQRIAEEASKQSGRDTVPGVIVASSLENALTTEALKGCTKFVCSLSPDARLLRDVVPVIPPVAIVIGPEGDLTSREERLLQDSQFLPISLGDLRLRSETAAVAAVAMVQAAGVISTRGEV